MEVRNSSDTTIILPSLLYFGSLAADCYFFSKDLGELLVILMDNPPQSNDCDIEKILISVHSLLIGIQYTHQVDSELENYCAYLQELKEKYNADAAWEQVLVILQKFAYHDYLQTTLANRIFCQKLKGLPIHAQEQGVRLLSAIRNSYHQQADTIPTLKQVFKEILEVVDDSTYLHKYQQFTDKFVSGRPSKSDQWLGRAMQAFGIALGLVAFAGNIVGIILLPPTLAFSFCLIGASLVANLIALKCYKSGSELVKRGTRSDLSHAMTLFGKATMSHSDKKDALHSSQPCRKTTTTISPSLA